MLGGGGSIDVRMIREIMLVPFPRAASSRLMSFFTFQISIYRATLSAHTVTAGTREMRATHVLLRLAGVGVAHGEELLREKDRRGKKSRLRLTPPREGKSCGFFSFLAGSVFETGILKFGGGVGGERGFEAVKRFMGWGKVAPSAPPAA